MKIVQVIPDFGIGGTQKAGCVLAKGVADAGHEAIVIGRAGGPRYLETPPPGARHLIVNPADDAAYAREILSHGPDVIHLHYGVYDEPLIKALSDAGGRIDGSPLLVATPIFGRPPKELKTLDRVRTCLIGAYMLYRQRHWLGMSTDEAIRNGIGVVHINSFEETDPPQSTLDPSEVRADRRAEMGVPADAFVVGRVGRNVAEKWSPSHEGMINQLFEKHANLCWLSVGMPSERGADRLKEKWGERFVNLPESPDFLVLAKAFAAMDLQIFFSPYGECFSTTICEAAAVGCPTIAGANPVRDNGQSEQLIDGVNGYLVASTAQARVLVDQLIADPERAQRLKQQTFDYAQARWTTAQIAQDLLAFYDAWRQPDPSATPHLKWVAEIERRFAEGYVDRLINLLGDSPVSRLQWRTKLALVRNWTAFRMAVRLKGWLSGS